MGKISSTKPRASSDLLDVSGQDAVVKTLEDRLSRLEAERDILQLFARYSLAVDVPDAASVGSCFAPDGRLELIPSSGVASARRFLGRDEISKFIAGQPPSPDVFQQHGVGEVRIVMAADATSATSESNFVVLKRNGGADSRGTPVVHAFGIYKDMLTLTDEGWVFQTRKAVYDGVKAVAS
jgi:hypothetical protein